MEDLLLAFACGCGDPESQRIFDASVLPRVEDVVMRLDRSPASFDEVRQALRVKLLFGPPPAPPKILDYSGRGPLERWVRAAALRMTLSFRRSVARHELGVEDLSAERTAADDPELAYLKQRYARELNDAFSSALRRLDAADRNLLRLHYVDGLSFIQLAHHHRVHRVTVSRWIDESRQRLLDDTRRLLSDKLQLGRHEFDSLIRLVHSQLRLRASDLLTD